MYDTSLWQRELSQTYTTVSYDGISDLGHCAMYFKVHILQY